MRGLLVVVHRWAGLFIAAFLFIGGLTGAVISWAQELDEYLNPELFQAHRVGAAISTPLLVQMFEAREPRARVAFALLSAEPGKTLLLYVEPKLDPGTKQLYDLGFDQVYVEPSTGEIAGTRLWGHLSSFQRDIIPFLYKMHYTMHMPDFFGIGGLGIWLMGLVGIVWSFDCFVGLCLTFPGAKRNGFRDRQYVRPTKEWFSRWSPAWKVKTSASSFRLTFDIHRAAGLWAWILLLVLASTSISMNLAEQVTRPLLSRLFTLTPEIIGAKAPIAGAEPLRFAPIVKIATNEAVRRQWTEPAGSIYFNHIAGTYRVSFFQPGAERINGLEPKAIYIDGYSGAFLGVTAPWAGTFADVFMQLQFPLHSGRILGLPGRILLSFLGVVVATLSFTGIYIWFKKRLARAKAPERFSTDASATVPGLYGAVVAFIASITDEGQLRRRIVELGCRATQVGTDRQEFRVSRVGCLAIDATFLFICAVAISLRQIVLLISRPVRLLVSPVREYGSLLLSRRFWESGRRDIVQCRRATLVFVKLRMASVRNNNTPPRRGER